MGTEFFDGLGETLTRTAKELGERAEQIYETQKLRNKISGEERIIDKVMADIGNLIYKRHVNGEALDSELSVLCEEIQQHMLKIKEYRSSAADIKGQKICPSCEKAVDKEVAFCPYCGAECPNPEPVKEQDDEIKETYEDYFQSEDTEDTAETPDPAEQTDAPNQGEEDCGSEEQEASCTEEQPVEEEQQ